MHDRPSLGLQRHSHLRPFHDLREGLTDVDRLQGSPQHSDGARSTQSQTTDYMQPEQAIRSQATR